MHCTAMQVPGSILGHNFASVASAHLAVDQVSAWLKKSQRGRELATALILAYGYWICGTTFAFRNLGSIRIHFWQCVNVLL